MTGKGTAAKEKSRTKKASGPGRGQKVWGIFHFQERFELPDDVRFDRKSPLIYTKDFVGSGTDDESCSYFRQIMSLRTRSNWLQLRGAFAELKNISANSSGTYRGYLLDSNYQPASDEQIGSWLGLGVKESKELLIQLSQAGLIEQVTMPDFEQSKETKTKKSAKKNTAKKLEGKTKVTSKKKPAGKNSVASRETTRKNERARTCLNKKVKVKVKVKVNGNEKIKEKINIGSLNHNEQEEQNEISNQSPPTTQPIEPTRSDAGSSVIQFPDCSRSAKNTQHSKNEPQAIGSIIAGIQHRYSPAAKGFAGDVFAALQLHCQPDSEQGRRELGCFASLWMDAVHSGLPPPELDQLRDRAISEAGRIVKHWHNRQGKPAAVWCKVFGDMLRKAGNQQAM